MICFTLLVNLKWPNENWLSLCSSVRDVIAKVLFCLFDEMYIRVCSIGCWDGRDISFFFIEKTRRWCLRSRGDAGPGSSEATETTHQSLREYFDCTTIGTDSTKDAAPGNGDRPRQSYPILPGALEYIDQALMCVCMCVCVCAPTLQQSSSWLCWARVLRDHYYPLDGMEFQDPSCLDYFTGYLYR